ncbi:unnamed protein product [Cylicocyclus nassatus]|uniref:Uncharacterized protein n=1 Tax=Cylicocyclus nassatus TaxID=53992 RepID=A0AA36M8I8_CYLNA|nr:unnamed protein product [Cylicocyclus nassatus]
MDKWHSHLQKRLPLIARSGCKASSKTAYCPKIIVYRSATNSFPPIICLKMFLTGGIPFRNSWSLLFHAHVIVTTDKHPIKIGSYRICVLYDEEYK